MVLIWGDHFHQRTVSSLIYFLNYSLLLYFAQLQILVISLYLAEFLSQVTFAVLILKLPKFVIYYYSTDYNLKINDIYECPKRVNFWWSPDFHHCDFHHRMIWPLMLDNWYQMSRFLNTDDFFFLQVQVIFFFKAIFFIIV